MVGEVIEADALDAPGFGDADLAQLLVGQPRLARLTLLLRSNLSPAALPLVAGACRQLVRLNLWGRFPLYSMCVEAAEATTDDVNERNKASGSPMFPELEWLGLTSVEQLDPLAAEDMAGTYADKPSEAPTASARRIYQAIRPQAPKLRQLWLDRFRQTKVDWAVKKLVCPARW